MRNHRFNYKWYLNDGFPAKGINFHGKKAFGTFVCGGGSTMGYKLAGYNHIGGVEFTDHFTKIYKENLDPECFYKQDINDFNKRNDLPDELYNLDLLDGSPPCAGFSTVGAREKSWGKETSYEDKFIIKDDLVFTYCDTILKLKPKVFILENVTGLIKGNAKSYAKRIIIRLSKKYNVQLFKLNAASMGVPQMRERVFFIGLKKDIKLPKLTLNFNERTIGFEEATRKFWDKGGMSIEKYAIGENWDEINYPNELYHQKRFSLCRPAMNRPCNTLTKTMSSQSAASVTHPLQKRKLNKWEASAIQSYPLDYNFLDQNPLNCIARSVPPVMMAQIAHKIYKQWLSKL
jgi:DNA (cytosine-5)-methyltransferase 1